MAGLFRETLVLNFPTTLPATDTSDPVFLWFSKLKRDGHEHPIIISLPIEMAKGVDIYAHGTEAVVIGGDSMVGKTLVVGALTMIATSPSTAVVAVPDSLPPFHSTVWPALLFGGVVSSPLLAAMQPELSLFHVKFHRQDALVGVPVEVTFEVVPRENDKPFVYDAVVVRGVTVEVTLGQFVVAVRDVCVASDVALVGPVDFDPSSKTVWSGPTCMRVSVFGGRPTAVIARRVTS